MNKKAIQAIKNGELVCFPTETVYALAANASDKDAVNSIYSLKGRDFNKPLAILVGDVEQAKIIAKTNEKFVKLAKEFCPGPITFILQKSDDFPLPSHFNPGVETIAIRIPRNDIALDVIKQSDCFIAATSVNLSGKAEAVNAQQINDYFGDAIKTVIDGGECDLKMASTIVDLSSDEVRIVREGYITEDMINKVL